MGKMNDKPAHIPALTKDGWQCAWYDNVATVSRSGCMRADCDKDGGAWGEGRKLAIVAEFLGLVTGVYGIYFVIWTTNIMDHVIKEKSQISQPEEIVIKGKENSQNAHDV